MSQFMRIMVLIAFVPSKPHTSLPIPAFLLIKRITLHICNMGECFQVFPEFRILRWTFHRKSASKS